MLTQCREQSTSRPILGQRDVSMGALACIVHPESPGILVGEGADGRGALRNIVMTRRELKAPVLDQGAYR